MADESNPEYIAIRDFVIAEAQYQQAKEKYSACREVVLNLLPKEIGEFEKSIEDFTLKVTYPEKVVWDTEQLDALYGSDKPPHVKMTYSIDKRVVKRLPTSEREELEKCYSVKPGSPTIDIAKN